MRRLDPLRMLRQRGAAGLAIVVLILLLMAAMIATTFTITERVVKDAVTDDQRAQALFLAESGMERASYRYIAGAIACGALVETMTMVASGGIFAISAGNAFYFDGVTALAAGQCRIRSTGTTVNGSVRIVEAILSKNPATSSSSNALQDSTSGNFTVASGTELLVVATTWRSAKPATSTITSATYNGINLTPVSSDYSYPPAPSCGSGSCDPLRASAQIFYLVNPPAGSHPLVFTLPNAPDTFVNIAFNLTGVDLGNPIDAFNGGGGLSSGIAFGATVTTSNKNDFIIDVVGREMTGNMSAAGCVPRNVIYDNNGANKIGAVSQCGPSASTGPFAMKWTWNQSNKSWASAVVAIRSASSGMIGWREVSVAPP